MTQLLHCVQLCIDSENRYSCSQVNNVKLSGHRHKQNHSTSSPSPILEGMTLDQAKGVLRHSSITFVENSNLGDTIAVFARMQNADSYVLSLLLTLSYTLL